MMTFPLGGVILFILISSGNIINIPFVSGQKGTEEIKVISSKENVTYKLTKVNMSVCANGDAFSAKYCTCSKDVASCDLSKVPGSLQDRTDLKIFVDEIINPVKRICLCGSPTHVRTNLTRRFDENSSSSPSNNVLRNVHRVDIYNFSGPLHLTDAFKDPFGGDFYMQNVDNLFSLRSEQFDRGRGSLEVEDVTGFKCCSNIITAQPYAKPTFYLDSVVLGEIHKSGIDSMHTWRTVIVKDVDVHRIHSGGISLTSENDMVNISVTNSFFKNVEKDGIILKDFQNAFLAKNYFHPSCNATAVIAFSDKENSSLVVVDNWFDNAPVMDMNAHRVLIWFNLFDVWDNYTFAFVPQSPPFPDAILSVEYNTVEHVRWENDSFSQSFAAIHGNAVFHENVFGFCNCSVISDAVISANLSKHVSRCDSLSTAKTKSVPENLNCLVDFSDAHRSCFNNNDKGLDFESLCRKSGIKKLGMNKDEMKTLSFKAVKGKVVSKFISDMLDGVKLFFHIHDVFHGSEEEEEESQYAKFHNGDGESGSAWLLTIVALIIIICFAGATYILWKQKRLPGMAAAEPDSESYGILTTEA